MTRLSYTGESHVAATIGSRHLKEDATLAPPDNNERRRKHVVGHTDAQAIRERTLSKLHIPDDVHPSFTIYRTELEGFAIGAALDDNQLLIDYQHFGDDKGTLKFLAQRADADSESPDADVPVPLPPPTIAPHASLIIFIFPSDRLASNGYDASVLGVSEFDTVDQDMARSSIQTLHRHPASRRGRRSTSWRVRRRGSGSGTSDMSPVAPQPAVPPGSSSKHLSNALSANLYSHPIIPGTPYARRQCHLALMRTRDGGHPTPVSKLRRKAQKLSRRSYRLREFRDLEVNEQYRIEHNQFTQGIRDTKRAH
ncbi:hypothetical protein RSAG8_09726, partial [Rhizoctonia solani AG-8 WAC10335]